MLSISRYIKEWELKNPTEIIPGRGDMNLEREAVDIVATNFSDSRFFEGVLFVDSSYGGEQKIDVPFYPQGCDGEFNTELALNLVDTVLAQLHEELLKHGINGEKPHEECKHTFVAHDMLCEVRKKIHLLKDVFDGEVVEEEK